MDEAHANTLAAVAAGRTAVVAQLRELADRLEQLPLDAAAEALIGLEHVLDEMRRMRTSAILIAFVTARRARSGVAWSAAPESCSTSSVTGTGRPGWRRRRTR